MLVIVLICGLFFVLFLFKYVNSGEDKDVSKSLFMLVCDKVDLKPYDVIIGSKKGYIKNSLLDMPNLCVYGESNSRFNFMNSILCTLLKDSADLKFLIITRNNSYDCFSNISSLYVPIFKNDYTSGIDTALSLISIRKKEFIKNKVSNFEEYNKNFSSKINRVLVIYDGNLDNLDSLKNIAKEGFDVGVHLVLSTSSDFTNSSKYFPVQVSFENDDDILYKKGTDADRLKYFAISDDDISDILKTH